MNSIKIRSGTREIEIVTDHPCSPRDLVDAAKEGMQLASLDTTILEAKTPELPAMITENENVIHMEAKVVKPEKRKSTGSGEKAQAIKRIGEIIAEGKFDNAELGLNDVQTTLASMTYNFGNPAVSHALAHYVRQKQLVRTGIRGKYKYTKRFQSEKSTIPQPITTENATVQASPLIAQ